MHETRPMTAIETAFFLMLLGALGLGFWLGIWFAGRDRDERLWEAYADGREDEAEEVKKEFPAPTGSTFL